MFFSLMSLGGPVLKEHPCTVPAWEPGGQEPVSRSSHEDRAQAAGSRTPASRDPRQPVESSAGRQQDAQPPGPLSGQCLLTYLLLLLPCLR